MSIQFLRILNYVGNSIAFLIVASMLAVQDHISNSFSAPYKTQCRSRNLLFIYHGKFVSKTVAGHMSLLNRSSS